ncbi:MAG: Putative transposase [Candidatus Midichloria mitochondrii]
MVYKQTLSNQGQNPLAAFKQLLLAGRGLIETAIGQLKEICQIQHNTASLAKQFLGRPLLRALGLCLQPNISHGKIGSRAYSLRQTEVRTPMK